MGGVVRLRGKKVIHADLPVETECSESHPSVSAPSAPSGEEGAASEPSVVELDAEPKTGEPLPNTAAEIASDERISEALRAESQEEEEEEPEVPPETPEVLEAPKVLEVPEKTPETPDLVLEAPEKCQAAKLAKKQAAKVRLQAAAKVVNDVGVVGRPEAPAPSAVAAATAAAKQQPLRPPPKNSPQLRPVPVAAQPPPKVGGGGGGGAPGGPPVPPAPAQPPVQQKPPVHFKQPEQQPPQQPPKQAQAPQEPLWQSKSAEAFSVPLPDHLRQQQPTRLPSQLKQQPTQTPTPQQQKQQPMQPPPKQPPQHQYTKMQQLAMKLEAPRIPQQPPVKAPTVLARPQEPSKLAVWAPRDQAPPVKSQQQQCELAQQLDNCQFPKTACV
ncbi:unnamed protein product [Polarella glacialis]|uniref:Uncharacterized protein n=2 Tax=Polarella glacialis TaxID=89957 RepID=A0A813DQX2_POLGL|nr:unnamed protein product [Polarella glacialis]